ncbi:MAG: site-specific integrase [Gammaproteobacteria bacterium]|nr:site-specific integrase [Gammaproteobacteria bacterium]
MTIPTSTQPRRTQVVRIWRQNRCLRSSTIGVYLLWAQRFRAYCRTQKLVEVSQLTLAGVDTFATWYASKRGIDRRLVFEGARSALRAWALALEAMDCPTPPWEPAPKTASPFCPLLEEFEEHLARHRGNPPATRKKKLAHITAFLAFLRGRQSDIAELALADIDAFIVSCREHYARTTVADMASSVRSFLRFLHTIGRLASDLAPSVMAPIVRRGERPLRALPWEKVQRILGAIDRSTAAGRRDYALLLLMSVYGLGAGEVLGLRLEDIDWRADILHVIRPKTGVAVELPLLPAVARVLVAYLRHGRPQHAHTRRLFISLRAPHGPLGASSAVRHILHKHAQTAGVSAVYLGSHVLRHTHACRELEQGVPPKVIGDILGHRRPESTSAYLRVATERLREVALALPT